MVLPNWRISALLNGIVGWQAELSTEVSSDGLVAGNNCLGVFGYFLCQCLGDNSEFRSFGNFDII